MRKQRDPEYRADDNTHSQISAVPISVGDESLRTEHAALPFTLFETSKASCQLPGGRPVAGSILRVRLRSVARLREFEHANFRESVTVRRIGVVSFLNARPLIHGLDREPGLHITPAVPSALQAKLEVGQVDVALLPIVDVIRSAGRLQVISDAVIACDGETMTVRVFSQVPPHKIQTLCVDGDSHTSVALSRVIWREWFEREIEIRPIDARRDPIDTFESVLLIGDKVVDQRRGSFAYEIDLGGAWRQHTGLPFVFAVWAARADDRALGGEELDAIAELLESARDRGVLAAAEIAREQGPGLGWPVELAERYLFRCLKFKLDDRSRAGAELFARHVLRTDNSARPIIRWPEACAMTEAACPKRSVAGHV
ncbi:MAG: menaquinone biosynthetic enzyme MqnA/MqnD family protein [Phycisphaerae bacterium]